MIKFNIFKRTNSYKMVFDGSKAAQIVLTDLARFCPEDPSLNAGSPIDDKRIYINIGRRQTLNHILAIINLTPEQLNAIARREANN